MPPVQIEGPVEVLSAQGVVCVADPAMPVIHLHGVVCDAKGQVRGGHFLSGNNPVHTTMDVVVTEIEGVRIEAEYDAEIDLVLPVPKGLSKLRRE
jgi:predicted DNA-binding protein with PD1-like motif